MKSWANIDVHPAAVLARIGHRLLQAFFIAAVLFVAGVLVWQGVTAGGSPNPTAEGTSPVASLFDIAVFVFREGLECVLVLAAIMAGMVGANQVYRRPIVAGVGIGMIATVATWFIAIRILSNLVESVSALHLQAATGLLAIIVLLVIMNWFSTGSTGVAGFVCTTEESGIFSRKRLPTLKHRERASGADWRYSGSLRSIGRALKSSCSFKDTI